MKKMSDNLVTESSKPWIKEVLEDTEESLCSCFLLVSLRCSRAALLTVVLLDARQLQHPHLGVCIGLHHSCFWRIDCAALFQNDGNLQKPAQISQVIPQGSAIGSDDIIAGNVSKYIVLPAGYCGQPKKGHLIFDACFESGNLGRVDHVTEFEYDLFIRPDTCNPRFRVWFNFTVENVKESQSIIFSSSNDMQNEFFFKSSAQTRSYEPTQCELPMANPEADIGMETSNASNVIRKCLDRKYESYYKKEQGIGGATQIWIIHYRNVDSASHLGENEEDEEEEEEECGLFYVQCVVHLVPVPWQSQLMKRQFGIKREVVASCVPAAEGLGMHSPGGVVGKQGTKEKEVFLNLMVSAADVTNTDYHLMPDVWNLLTFEWSAFMWRLTSGQKSRALKDLQTIVPTLLRHRRVIFNVVNFSKTKSLYRDGMAPMVKSTSRPKCKY
ncbi:hypothetical protein IHE44_0015079 [Lamprotornis superbus]|uniref:Cytosolic carboxypeptidase N-terminal domain-containing protein n=1 Tax=Lamprotornis superbus TaxID=245042 RepID=A0A835TVB6_9PASS|nr:hypothetical protein IHE44_0015079 [Lamprotornis superbus]